MTMETKPTQEEIATFLFDAAYREAVHRDRVRQTTRALGLPEWAEEAVEALIFEPEGYEIDERCTVLRGLLCKLLEEVRT